MGAREFGQKVEEARIKKGWTRADLAVAIGILPSGHGLDVTQIRRLIEGGRRLDSPEGTEVIQRLIKALDLNPADAWFAAGTLPPDLDPDDWRLFTKFAELRKSQPELVAAAERELVAITGEFAAVGAGTRNAGARSHQGKSPNARLFVFAGQRARRGARRGNRSLVPTFAQPAVTLRAVAA